MKDLHNFIYSQEVLEFLKCSQNFCKWIEDSEISDSKSFVQQGLKILPNLYSWMISIPAIEPVFDEATEKFVTEEDWSVIYRKVTDTLGALNDYNDIPERSEYDRSELIIRKISEDISDIYQDIRDFLEVFRNSPEEIMNDALWECKTLFEDNWGEKLLRVSRAMHMVYIMNDTNVAESEQKSMEADSYKKIDTSDWFITKRQQQFGEEDEIISE
jgi:hypothetical protein